MRIGHGYDIHKLAEDRKLIIGGVEIPYSKGLLGHTDADVLIHAIIDALLGASGLGDIGQYFPDNDPKWKDAKSLDLLEVVFISLKNKGHIIVNIDSTVIAQEPKLAKYTPQMKDVLSKALAIKDSQINIKAKTNEGLDSVGEKNAICAYAVASIL
ncbi:MAG: 2-C-methyl-D-erythritol 2,4-cyclodiphosphate synthase [Candidatus Melainabacteria bacterium RIFCSPHIGHO2_02_FULL_34_12]|nr:MAG: 2-C-methyl-D-erythritol 2,4-cyclodiphosphate synthase [Candidatus Melainabacteria bacterium RIFCSPHIGHO2_02_FULL_34_12]